MHTTAVWWQVEAAALVQVFAQPWRALDGFLGAAYAMHYVAALLTMSELRDLGRAVGNSDATWFATLGMERRGQPHVFGTNGIAPQDVRHFQPTVFLYDNYPGGIGLSTPLYDRRREVVQQAYDLVSACACLYGCPACVGPILAAGESDGPTPKEAARLVLALLTGKGCDGA
jgi:DEAD/DEAH box helicase domain-containing protein